MSPVAVMIALALGLPSSAERKYDKFRDVSSAGLEIGQVGGPGEDVQLFVYRFSKGKKIEPIGDDEDIVLYFFSKSERWKYLKEDDVILLGDGKRFPASGGLQEARISREGPGVQETVAASLKFADFAKIAASSKVEIAVGKSVFRLDSLHVKDIRKFAAEMRLDALGVAALERKEADEKRLRSEQEAKAKQDLARLEKEANAEWDAKVAEVFPVAKKALKEARSKGWRSNQTVREQVTNRLVNDAASKLCETYKLTREELDKLMDEGSNAPEKANEDRAKKKAEPAKK